MMLACAASVLAATEWSPQKAAEYLDGRQAVWAAWPHAAKPNGPCLSCHTGLFYLMARPVLARALHEDGKAVPEAQLLAAVRSRADAREAAPAGAVPGAGPVKGVLADRLLATQAILTPLVLASADRSQGKLSAEAEAAFRRMWSLQLQDGPDRGGWAWSSFDLDPWEMPDSAFFGAAVAAAATGIAPAGYQDRPEIRANLAALREYIRSHEAAEPLHNRLTALWAASRLHDLLPDSSRQAILAQLWRGQGADGGFSMAVLGPWKERPAVPPTTESSGYATAWVAFTTEQAGVKRRDPKLARAITWLKTHQDPDGSWPAISMNKQRDSAEIPAGFMRDAATALAVMALLE